jgi:hypothetical protein
LADGCPMGVPARSGQQEIQRRHTTWCTRTRIH